MNIATIGKLERVSLREVWRHEAKDFTQWLQQNIDVLGEALGLGLANAEREQAAGAFSIDLVAEIEGGGAAIIENQLARSDHDHLGKLITYLTAMSAKAAVWVVSEPRPEHMAAIQWLNQAAADVDFYMVKVEAVRIGASPAAALFTKLLGPSVEARQIGQARKEVAERHPLRRAWWASLIERSAKVSPLHARITPGETSWIGASSGFRGLNYNYVVNREQCAAELYIDRGPGAEEETVRLFKELEAHKPEIEAAFGGPLEWDTLSGRRMCRIRFTCRDGGYRSPEDRWPAIQDAVIAAMVRLEGALKPWIGKLRERA